MITREELRQLAQVEDPRGAAVTFYFQPTPPRNKSHREEAILVKDLVKAALREAERGGNHSGVRADLARILEMAEQLHGNHARAKAVFACSAQGIWREYDLPARLRRTQVLVNQRFHLKPLAGLVEQFPRCAVAVTDREKARFFLLRSGEVSELEGMVEAQPRHSRSDGFAGYNAGRVDRHADHHSIHHFKNVAEKLQGMAGSYGVECYLAGSREEVWAEFEPYLHTYVRQRLVGHFAADPVSTTTEEVMEQTRRALDEHRARERQALLREVLGESQRNGRGAVGLRRVLTSLERGEVQVLVIGEEFSAAVAECANCGHLDTRHVKNCAACGRETRMIDDVSEVLSARALREGIRVLYVSGDADFTRAGDIGALLRFRADQNTPEKLAV